MTKAKAAENATTEAASGETPVPPQASVIWNDAQMATIFANVINIINTREEFSLFFGTNQTWNPVTNHQLVVDLSNRIVLTPYAAKRLHLLLSERLADYEKRFGTLDLGA